MGKQKQLRKTEFFKLDFCYSKLFPQIINGYILNVKIETTKPLFLRLSLLVFIIVFCNLHIGYAHFCTCQIFCNFKMKQ